MRVQIILKGGSKGVIEGGVKVMYTKYSKQFK